MQPWISYEAGHVESVSNNLQQPEKSVRGKYTRVDCGTQLNDARSEEKFSSITTLKNSSGNTGFEIEKIPAKLKIFVYGFDTVLIERQKPSWPIVQENYAFKSKKIRSKISLPIVIAQGSLTTENRVWISDTLCDALFGGAGSKPLTNQINKTKLKE